jgi:hypothetical protein
MMQIFIAGVMQGVRRDHLIDDQSYRVRITRAITEYIPTARVYDPWALSPGSVDFDAETAFNTFHRHLGQAGKMDALIAYLPTASMGTAMEMWQAYQSGVPIIAVSPMHYHWAIRFTASKILPDLDALLDFIASGQLPEFVRNGAG